MQHYAIKTYVMKSFIFFCLYLNPCLSWCQWGLRPQQGESSLRISETEQDGSLSRRDCFEKALHMGSLTVATSLLFPNIASAETPPNVAATVTDKVFVEVKGLPTADGSTPSTQRIVIGLFGKESPQSVEKLKQLMGSSGLPATCKPKEERVLQREQLEANKVYNSCIEGENKGVNYDYAQIWRIIKDERIDMGSVAGKYVAREYPTWGEG